MKRQLQFCPAVRLCRAHVALLAFFFAAGLAAIHAASPPSLQLLQPGKWPKWPRGEVFDVKVSGQYAYLALGWSGLAVIDISNPTNSVQVGGHDKGFAAG